MLRWLLASLFTVVAHGQTPTEALLREKLKVAGPRDVVVVPDELIDFNEPSLPEDKELFEDYRRQRDQQMLLLGHNTTFLGESDREERWPNGSRLVELRLAPGESLAVKLLESRLKVWLYLPLPKGAGPMQDQIRKLRRWPAVYKDMGFTLKNTTSEPFVAKVWVLGRTGYPYRLEIHRQKAAPAK